MSACEDRGADLLVAARGGEVPPGLRDHLASCAPCRAEIASLKEFAASLPFARGGIRARPGTRAALLEVARAGQGVESHHSAALPLRRGRVVPMWVSAAAVLAACAAGIWIGVRHRGDSPAGPGSKGRPPVEALDLFGGAFLTGIGPSGLDAGKVVEATKTAGLRLGAPVHAEIVLGGGTRVRVPANGGGRRVVEVLAGSIFVEPAPDADPAAGPLRVTAGGTVIEDRGARFAVEVAARGEVAVTVETGVVSIRAGGVERAASGPCRVEVPVAGPPGEPAVAEAADATAWFAFPELTLALRGPRDDGGHDLVLELRPSVPRGIRIAPFHRLDPLFTLFAEHAERGQAAIPVQARILRPPPPPDGGPDGAFLLGPRKPYTITVDAGALGLVRGRYRLKAVYAAGRPGGLWRGTRTSNEVELEVP